MATDADGGFPRVPRAFPEALVPAPPGDAEARRHVLSAAPAAHDEPQRVVFGRTLAALMEVDPRVLVLDADLANSTRADIVAEAHPERFLEMGIAEQNMVGAAAGLATMGFRPWLSSFAVFLVERALDQVRMLVAQTHLPVRLAGAYSGLLTGFTGKTHQSMGDLAVMRAMPFMTVLCPADARECQAAMLWAADHPGPVYVRLARDPAPAVFPAALTDYRPERATWLRRGRDLTLVGTGLQSARNLAASQRLAADGVDAGVLHLPALKPFDSEAVLAAADPGLVVTVEEHNVIGGLGALVAEELAQHRPTRVVRWGIPDVFGESGPNADLLQAFGLSADEVAARVRHLLDGTPAPTYPRIADPTRDL